MQRKCFLEQDGHSCPRQLQTKGWAVCCNHHQQLLTNIFHVGHEPEPDLPQQVGSVSVVTRGEGPQLNHCFQGELQRELLISLTLTQQRSQPKGMTPLLQAHFLNSREKTMKTPGNSFTDSWAGIKASTNNWENGNAPSKYCWGKKALLHFSTCKEIAGWAVQNMLAAFPRRFILLGSVYKKAQWGGQLWAEPRFGKAAQLLGQPGQRAGNCQSKSSPLCSDCPTCDKGNSSLVLKACGH